MAWFLWFIIWKIFISSIFGETDYPHGIPEIQYEELYDLYNSTDGTNWYWEGSDGIWDFNDPSGNPCFQDWQGLSCDCPSNNTSYCVIISLNLEFYLLVGSLPESMSNLQNLSYLNLQNNGLTGPIPSSFGLFHELEEVYLDFNQLISIPDTLYNCSRLQILSLSSNRIQGTISPLIGKLSQLVILDLENNDLTGSIPSSFGLLNQLEDVSLNVNQLISIPDTLYNCSRLYELSLSSNRIQGTISPLISKLSQLVILDLGNNSLTGPIPDGFPPSNLETLSLQQNLLSSSLPLGFSSLNQLVFIFLYDNSFTGEFVLPNPSYASILWIYDNFFSGNLSSMQHIQQPTYSLVIYSNQFTGDLPTCSQSCMSTLGYYETTSNYFTSTMPLEFSYFADLTSFDIASNFLIGSVRPKFNACQTLFYFNISYNLLTGTIPNNFLRIVYEYDSSIILSNNFFTGSLPVNYQQFEVVNELDFSNNYLTGTIPQSYSQLIYLEEFYIQNNNLNSPLNDSLQVMNDLNLINLDFSNNQFTGSIPPEFFQKISRQYLETFSISINCLTGFLPNDVCNATKLTALDLDGLSSAEKCRQYLFPDNPLFTSFTVKSTFGSLPSCVLTSLIELQLLHASGNGLTGTLPDAGYPQSLTDLSLSHNSLRGTIPLSLQTRTTWKNFDLSFNKLTGTLSPSFASISANGSLSLQINRLSGDVPSSLLDTNTITILAGNLFYCLTEEKSDYIPQNDQDYANYVCSTDTSLQFIIIMVIVGIPCVAVLIMLIATSRYQRAASYFQKTLDSIKEKVVLWRSAYSFPAEQRGTQMHETRRATLSVTSENENDNNSNNNSIYLLGNYFVNLQRIVLIVMAYLVFVEMPIWIALTFYYGNYQNEYIWTVSAILISGETPAVIMLIIFIISTVVFMVAIAYAVKSNEAGNIIPDNHISLSDYNNYALNKSKWWGFVLYGFLFVFDVVLMFGLDVSFIVATLNLSSVAIVFMVILISIAKLIVQNILLWKLLRWIYNFLSIIEFRWRNANTDYSRDHLRELWRAPYYPSLRDSSFIAKILIINKICLPVIAAMFILPDCFYYALFSSPPVTSSYSYTVDTVECTILESLEVACYEYLVTQTAAIAYTPSFNYSYVCASNIIIQYVNLYIWTYLFIGFIIPLSKIAMKHYYDGLYRRDQQPQSLSNYEKIMKSLLERSLPKLLLLPYESSSKPSLLPLFPTAEFLAQMNSYLSFLLSFGGIFPPLGVLVGVSILIVIQIESLLIGKLLIETKQLGYQWYEKEIAKESSNIVIPLQKNALWMMVIPCWLFAFLIFDTWGDSMGWKYGLIGLICMAFIPLLIVGFQYYCCNSYSSLRMVWKTEREDLKEEKDCNVSDDEAIHEGKDEDVVINNPIINSNAKV